MANVFSNLLKQTLVDAEHVRAAQHSAVPPKKSVLRQLDVTCIVFLSTCSSLTYSCHDTATGLQKKDKVQAMSNFLVVAVLAFSVRRAAGCATSVSGTGFPFESIGVIRNDNVIWHEARYAYKWKDVPDELKDALYFKSEHTYPPTDNSPATLTNDGTTNVDIYIIYEPSGSADVNRDGGFGSGAVGFSDTGLQIDNTLNHDNAGPMFIMNILKKDTPLPPGASVTLPKLAHIDVCRDLNIDRIHDKGACNWIGAYAMKCSASTTTPTTTPPTTTTVSQLLA